MSHTNQPLSIEVKIPCEVSWDSMMGDARSRFCGQCKLNVYNLSEMTNTQARELIKSKEGNLCGRFYRRTDNTVVTKDCLTLRAMYIAEFDRLQTRRKTFNFRVLMALLAMIFAVVGFLTVKLFGVPSEGEITMGLMEPIDEYHEMYDEHDEMDEYDETYDEPGEGGTSEPADNEPAPVDDEVE